MARKTYQAHLELDEERVKRFRSFYPQKGSLRWFVNACLTRFNEIHEDRVDTEIEKAVKEVLANHSVGG
jgi:hypothetical protein